MNYGIDGVGLAEGNSTNFSVITNLLYQPVGQFQSTNYRLHLGPYYVVPVVPAGEDTDGDGVPDVQDNCPDDPNPDQLNSDNHDGGDMCDPVSEAGLHNRGCRIPAPDD